MTAEPPGHGPHHPAFDGCFGCAPACPGGLGVRKSGGAFEFTIQPGHQGAPGWVHGGVLAAALDEAMGMVAWSLGRPCSTARLEVDYLIPVPLKGAVRITARCAGREGRKLYLTAEARLDDVSGPVAARAAALYVQPRLPARPGGVAGTGPADRNWTGQRVPNWSTRPGQPTLP